MLFEKRIEKRSKEQQECCETRVVFERIQQVFSEKREVRKTYQRVTGITKESTKHLLT